jgi:hypothetical protein
MKITKRQLKRIIREEYNRIFNEHGDSDEGFYDDEDNDDGIPLDDDRVSWSENNRGDVVWNIDELDMEYVSQDEIYEVLNDPETDEGLMDAINKAFADYEDYMYSS